jgi:serine phosphatase RsbU (regulator of sigma subunit)
MKKILIISLFLLTNVCLRSQSLWDKAQSIFFIAQETKWLDEGFDTYHIVFFDNQDSLYNYTKQIIDAGRQIQNKTVNIKQVKNLEELKLQIAPQIIYISHKNLKDLDSVYNYFTSPGIMIITDRALPNNPDYCVNFLPKNSEGKLYELNTEEAYKRHLSFSENLLMIGAKEDVLRTMYRDTVMTLRNRIENLKKQVYIIQEQQRIIDLKKELLDSLQQKISNQKNEAERLKRYIANIQHNLLAKKQELALHRKLLEAEKNKLISEQNKQKELENKLKTEEEKIKAKEAHLKNINQELTKALKRIQTQADIIKLAILILFALLSVVYLYAMSRKKNKEIQEKNDEIVQINEELKQNQKIIEEKNTLLSEHIKEIQWSLQYAEKIQKALLPTDKQLSAFFKSYFLIYLPKNIVSGDFYYINQKGKYKFFGVGDCTGHGVGGALMSIMSITSLHEIIQATNVYEAGKILDALRSKIKKIFKHFGNESSTGLDMVFCIYNTETKELQYSGAYLSLFLVHNEEIVEYKATRNPIGSYPKEIDFETKGIVFHEGDKLYLSTDGFFDQLTLNNSVKKSKFTKGQFKYVLKKISKEKMELQKERLLEIYDNWKNIEEQTDDITILGVEL